MDHARLLADLAAIDSVNPALVPGAAGEAEIADYVAGMRRPHDPEIRDGRLYGRGAFDMKGGLAAIMLAGGAAAGAGLRGDVVVTAVADEEHATAGVQAVLRR